MKRWAAALVAVLFLSVATLHVYAHHGESDDACTVCQAQSSTSLPAAAPSLTVVWTFEAAPARRIVSVSSAARDVSVPARAPPSLHV